MNAPVAATSPDVVGLRLTGAMLSDVGCVRPHNEDAVAFVVPTQDGTTAQQDALLLVADGMGGHAAGEIASTLAAEVVRRVYFELAGGASEALAAAFKSANKAIHDYAQAHPECAGMGTTCTALAVRGSRAWLAHVGDTRAYLLRGATLTQLSEDQTLVAKLVRDGVLTEQQASRSEHNNVILQALGTTEKVEPDIWHEGLAVGPGDILVLTSDGLHGLVSDATIGEIAARLSPLEACRALIQHAMEAGGHDNASVGVFRAHAAGDTLNAQDRATRRLRVPQHLLAESGNELGTTSTRQIATSKGPT
jgi:serine/threonine protein phosphatase PrpC